MSKKSKNNRSKNNPTNTSFPSSGSCKAETENSTNDIDVKTKHPHRPQIDA